MPLFKAIASGKEWRKPYRRSKAFDSSCWNHGGCPWCESNRQYADKKYRQAADAELRTFKKYGVYRND